MPATHPEEFHELAADDFPVAVTCWILKVSTSGSYDWRSRSASCRYRDDPQLFNTIAAIHAASR
jgi:hypothetical protein